jgi:hypothetical protein
MECLLHRRIQEVHVRIFFFEAIPKENIGKGKVLGLLSTGFPTLVKLSSCSQGF